MLQSGEQPMLPLDAAFTDVHQLQNADPRNKLQSSNSVSIKNLLPTQCLHKASKSGRRAHEQIRHTMMPSAGRRAIIHPEASLGNRPPLLRLRSCEANQDSKHNLTESKLFLEDSQEGSSGFLKVSRDEVSVFWIDVRQMFRQSKYSLKVCQLNQ